MTVLAAVLIGGTAFTGGEGGVFGTMIGVLFLGVVQNGLTLSGVSSFWQGMVSGSILIFAVWLGGVEQILRRKRRAGEAEGPISSCIRLAKRKMIWSQLLLNPEGP